jgi:hypothetical protein
VRELRIDKALAPHSERLNDGPKLADGVGQAVFEDVGIGWRSLAIQDARRLQLFEPLRQQRGRHSRYAAPQVIEPRRASNKLA